MEAKKATLPLSRAPASRALDAAREALSATWVLGALVFAVTWGGGFVSPTPFSLDISTYAGFNIAAERGLDFGSEVLLTYGPLGFLKTYLAFYEWPARLAVLYGLGLHLALAISLVHAARRSFPLPLAVAAALVAALLLRGDLAADAVRSDAAVVVLALIWCVIALTDRTPSWAPRLVVLAGGPFAALEILAKPSVGLVVLALVVATAAAMEGDRRRNLGLLAATFLPSLAAFWFAAGEGIGDIGPFVSGIVETASGYSSGARLEWETRDYDYLLAPAAIAVVAGIAWVSTSGLPRGRRIVALALLALVAFTTFKAGFVSHDEFHMATFYSTMLGACLAFRLPPRMPVRIAAGVAIAGVAAAGFTPAFSGYPLTDPIENLRTGGSTIATLADPGRLEDEIAESRAAMVAEYGLDGRTLELLRGHTVHVDPSEVSAAWAYELDWSPLPVFEPYVASWTPELDRRNAEALAAADGPERILRQATNPLGRYPGFDSPAAMVEMLCNYAPLRTQGAWQVLGRIPDRCGAPRALGSASGAYGEPIAVPRGSGDELVIGKVDGVGVSGLEWLESTLHRADARRVSFDETPGYVFIGGTAEDGLLLRAPARADFPAGFALAPNADRISFLRDGAEGEGQITVDYFGIPVRS